MTARARLSVLVVGVLCPAGRVAAQAPTAAPTPNFQDEFAFPQVRFSLDSGSGARALGMGGAFLARPDDATAATWNPAGLSYLRLPEISAAGIKSVQTSRGRFEGVLNNDDRLHATNPDFLAVAYPITAGDVRAAAQLSFQRVLPFGGSRDIARSVIGEDASAQVQLSTSGGFDIFTVGLGAQVSHAVRIGATVNRWTNGFGIYYVADRPRPGTRIERQTKLDLKGVNFNLGVIVSPFKSLNVGVVGKTAFTGDATLNRSRIDYPLAPSTKDGLLDVATKAPKAPTSNSYFSDDLRVRLPASLGMGASWRAGDQLTISMDVTRTFWSRSYINNFFVVPPLATGDAAASAPQVFDKLAFPTLRGPQQTDTQQIRAGVEYVLIRSSFKWPFRIGYINDRQYFQALDGPPHFNAFTVGTGILVGALMFDVAYVLERGDYIEKSDTGTPGNHWTTTSHRFVGSLIYRFSGD